MNKNCYKIFISGRVQGVGYRYNALKKALELNLTGWVKNTFDGKVEAFIEGEPENTEKFILWCHKGPSMAHVEHVEVLKHPYLEEFTNFKIKG